MKRRLPRFGRSPAFRQFFLTLTCLAVGLQVASAQPVLKVVNGRIKEIRPEEAVLVLSYSHPVSGKTEELSLQVTEKTGFQEEVRLEDFEKEDPVSIDYEEKENSLPLALLVKRVPVKGVPKELAR